MIIKKIKKVTIYNLWKSDFDHFRPEKWEKMFETIETNLQLISEKIKKVIEAEIKLLSWFYLNFFPDHIRKWLCIHQPVN
jgi:hypothetical protein